MAGSALATAGTAAVVVGAYFLSHTQQCGPQPEAVVVGPPCGALDGFNQLMGWASVAGGAAFLAAGIPMIAVGSWRIPGHEAPMRAELGPAGAGGRLSITF